MIPSIWEAREYILAQTVERKTEMVPLNQSLGRISATSVVVPEDIPPFPISRRDGYALRAQDTYSPPTYLQVVGGITAGEGMKGGVEKGEAIRIMTGALIPPGANAVVEQEMVFHEEGRISIPYQVKMGSHLTPVGFELRKGEKVLQEGERIHPFLLGVLASLEQEELLVYCRPKTGILTTGDELVELGCHPAPYQLVNSNGYLLAGMVEGAGGIPILLPTVPDRKKELVSAMKRGLQEDIFLTTGGLGGGEHDLILSAWKEIGIIPEFQGVQARPGKRVFFGFFQNKPIFSLPGSPGALMVLFLELIEPLLYQMQGVKEMGYSTAILTQGVENRGKGSLYLPGYWQEKGGIISLEPIMGQSYSSSAVQANALFLVPEKKTFKVGEPIQFRPLLTGHSFFHSCIRRGTVIK